MAIVGTVGLLGNSMMIVVFALNRSVSNNYRNTATSECLGKSRHPWLIILPNIYSCSQLHTDFHSLVINMVVAEFVIACYGVPVDIAASSMKGWKLGQVWCDLTGFIQTTACKILDGRNNSIW